MVYFTDYIFIVLDKIKNRQIDSGTASVLGSGGRGFDPRLRHTKDVKMVQVAPLIGINKGRNWPLLSKPCGN
jgi:hypothetical protein